MAIDRIERLSIEIKYVIYVLSSEVTDLGAHKIYQIMQLKASSDWLKVCGLVLILAR